MDILLDTPDPSGHLRKPGVGENVITSSAKWHVTFSLKSLEEDRVGGAHDNRGGNSPEAAGPFFFYSPAVPRESMVPLRDRRLLMNIFFTS